MESSGCRKKDKPRPINRYGFSKWKGEQAVLASGARALVIRTAWLYGSVGKNFVKSIMRAAQSEGILKVVDDQSGCPTYAGDLAAAVASLVAKDVEGVIHVTNRGQCTWYEFAQAIVREMGFCCSVIPITTEQAGRLAKRPPYSVLSPDRLASMGLRCRDGARHWRDLPRSPTFRLVLPYELVLLSVKPLQLL